jgi:multidrug efflux pump subunit AcrA (membrane-fusion protein)
MGLMTEDGYPHQGQLKFIDNAMDAKSGTINGRAIFANADGRFTPGLFARIRLVSDTSQTVALAPDRAVATDLGKRFVVVVGQQQGRVPPGRDRPAGRQPAHHPHGPEARRPGDRRRPAEGQAGRHRQPGGGQDRPVERPVASSRPARSASR